MVTGQLADATGDFECLVFVLLAASARSRVVQSETCLVREMPSPQVGNPRGGVSASCPVTVYIYYSRGSPCIRFACFDGGIVTYQYRTLYVF